MTQAQALTILKTGASVFLTGEPGAGKTYVINEYVNYLRAHDIEPAITASTGIAATHIHGQTIHSWSGIGIRKYLSSYDLDHIATTEYLSRRIRNTAVLIIDEISMIDAATLDMVDQVCREVRQKPEPFGGIQVILVGDFFQLPPVSRNNDSTMFAFSGNAWETLAPIVCYLSEQHRQSDEIFLSVLSAIRGNYYSEEHHEHLSRRMVSSQGVVGDDAIALDDTELTRLFAHNADVDSINTAQLQKLSGDTKTYHMVTKGSANLVASLIKGCLSPETLTLKLGAVVMCTKNSKEKGYVNGTLGKVVDFAPTSGYPIIETRDGFHILIEPTDWNIEVDGKVKATITQLPLRLAWAITIHKSQGLSLDAAVMDLSQVFEYGQGYVALSRVRTLDGLYLLGTNRQAFMVHPTILEQDEQFQLQSESAQQQFAVIEPEILTTMHERFITACGGTLGVKKAGKRGAPKKDTLVATFELVREGVPIVDIATSRGMVFATIVSHIEKLIAQGKLQGSDIAYIVTPELEKILPKLRTVFAKHGTEFLTPVYKELGEQYDYDTLRIARLIVLAENA